MDAPVGNEGLQRAPGNLAADRIEAGDDDRVRRVIDDHVDASRSLERPDVPPLAADDPALHLVAGERDRRHCGLGGVFRGEPLGRHRDDPLGVALRPAAGLLLDVAHQGTGLGTGLVLHPLENFPARVLGREPGDPLEPAPLLLDQLLDLRLPGPQVELALGQRLFLDSKLPLLTRYVFQLPLQRPAAIFHPMLGPLPLLAAALDLAVELLPQLERLHLPGDHPGIERRLRFPGRVALEPGRFGLRLSQDASPLAALNPGAHQVDQKRDDEADHQPEQHQHGTAQLRKRVDQGSAHSGTDTVPAARCPRLAGGRRCARSSAMAEIRAAISRSPRRAWNSSSVIASAARMAALWVSTPRMESRTRLSAASRYAATSRVYSGGNSDLTVYSSPPMMTRTAFLGAVTTRCLPVRETPTAPRAIAPALSRHRFAREAPGSPPPARPPVAASRTARGLRRPRPLPGCSGARPRP